MAERTRSTYRLVFVDDVAGVGKIVEFDAFDASEALTVASQERHGRLVELWHGEIFLCLLRRDRADIWKVVDPSRESTATS